MNTPSNELEGTRWLLASAIGEDGAVVPATAAESTAVFEGGAVGGSGGCNRFGGSYAVEGDRLTVGPLHSTLMACEPARMAQEQAFLIGLQAAARFALDGERLTIFNAAGQIALTFVAQKPVPLAGSSWVATGINNGRQAVVSIVAGTTVGARFSEDGSLAGSAGCNRYKTTYQVEGATIAIQPPAATRMMCQGEGVMEQEAAYLSQLLLAASYRIDGRRLELRSATGALLVSYTLASGES